MTFLQSFVELMKLWLSHFLQSSLTPGITHAMLDLNGFVFALSWRVTLKALLCTVDGLQQSLAILLMYKNGFF